jgi:hypothetical protein
MSGSAPASASHWLARCGIVAGGLLVASVVAFAGALGGLGLASPPHSAALTRGATAVAVPSAVPNFTIAQIGAVAEAAGFRGSALVMAIAVALAESGGDPTATDHDQNGTVDRGLWQINSVHSQFSAACDYDPRCAAGAAFSISSGGTNWQPWVTYENGAEIPFLPAAASFVKEAKAP